MVIPHLRLLRNYLLIVDGPTFALADYATVFIIDYDIVIKDYFLFVLVFFRRFILVNIVGNK